MNKGRGVPPVAGGEERSQVNQQHVLLLRNRPQGQQHQHQRQHQQQRPAGAVVAVEVLGAEVASHI